MEDNTPKPFKEEDSSKNNLIAIKYFFFESKARLYAARLEAEGIPSFVSNSNAITAVPLGSPGIGLHIRKKDFQLAQHIILQMDQRAVIEQTDEEESFRDADHEDIDYQRQLHKGEAGANKNVQYFIVAIILLVLIRLLWKAFNGEGVLDFF